MFNTKNKTEMQQPVTNGNGGATLISSGTILKGDIAGNQADITGKVSGNIRAKELLQLRGECLVTGNLYAGKLQVEPSATFNGQCHMGANIVEMSTNEQAAAIQ